jgi:hypothetical protein
VSRGAYPERNNEIFQEPQNPWSPQDEGDHLPIKKEWWTNELFFITREDQHTWNLMTTFAHTQEPVSCFFQYVLIDCTTGKCVLHKDINDAPTELFSVKNRLDLRYKNNTLQGLYPTYRIHHQDEDNDFDTDLRMEAHSLPHWITQEITNGILPIGLNHYRYGFLPNCTLTGIMTLQGKHYNLEGKGYLEHAYGNWSYENPLQRLGDIRKTLGTYLRLGYWWLSHHRFHVPRRIGFATENNSLGYDWLWAVCENNWSFFFGNSLLWVNDGPAFGTLYVTRDGKHYWEFSDVHFKYTKVIYLKDQDVYYPSDMELTGRLDNKTINLRFTSTTEGYEYVDPRLHQKFYRAYILCQLPGRVEGTFTEDRHVTKLQGLCKNVPLRESPRKGHAALRFTFLQPPQGMGLIIDRESHRTKRKSQTIIQLAPRLRLCRKTEPLDVTKIPRVTILD